MYVEKLEFIEINKTFFSIYTDVDVDNASEDTLERLRNITKMFSGKDDEHQELQKIEKFAPSEKIKRTFQK